MRACFVHLQARALPFSFSRAGVGPRPFGFSSSSRANDKGKVNLPIHEIDFKYVRSSGPGGQNVNKLATAVQARFHIETSSWLTDIQKEQLRVQHPNRINQKGEFVLFNQDHRSQHRNKDACLQHLKRILEAASAAPKERQMWTEIGGKAKSNRLARKKHKSRKKGERRRSISDY